jgi:hypothetical protein
VFLTDANEWTRNMGAFHLNKKNQFAFPECPVAKWNATAWQA